MPSTMQSNFLGGRWAPEYHGRTDLQKYGAALAKAENFLVQPQGGTTKRPGFPYIATPKAGNAAPVKLRKFVLTNRLAYVLEFGNLYLRFYRARKPILSGGIPYEIVTPYATADLAALTFYQYQGTMFIFHPNHPTQSLVWTADANWSISATPFTDGPYMNPPTHGTTMTPSSAAGTVTITASSLADINSGAGFQNSDIGRQMRFGQPQFGFATIGSITAAGTLYSVGNVVFPVGGTYTRQAQFEVTSVNVSTGAVTSLQIIDPGQYSVMPASPCTITNPGLGGGLQTGFTSNQAQAELWTWGTITAVADTLHCTVALQTVFSSFQQTFLSTIPLTDWRLGAWSATTGYPTCGVVVQGRLWTGGDIFANRLQGSETDSFFSHAPTLPSGQVIDSNAVAFDLDVGQDDPIQWLAKAGSELYPQLAAGTGSTEFVIGPGSTGQAITPTSINAPQSTHFGSVSLTPLRIGKALIFVDKSSRKLREWLYNWQAGGNIGPEVSPFGVDLLRPGIVEFDYAQVPDSIIWCLTADGALAGLTYQQEAGEAAWHRTLAGGNYYGAPGFIESFCVVPTADLSYDEIWVSVLRGGSGGLVRTIEAQTAKFFGGPLDQAVFVDSAVSSALTYPNATCTLGNGPFTPSDKSLPQRGDEVTVSFSANVANPTDPTMGRVLRINGGTFIANGYVNAQIGNLICVDSPTSLAPATQNNWSYTTPSTTWSGFDAFNGQSVTVLADGAAIGTAPVAGGIITLPAAASYVTAGYGYAAELETLDLDLPAQDGTGQMKEGYVDHLYMRLLNTYGGSYGPTEDNIDPIELNDPDIGGWVPPAITDDIRLGFPGGHSNRRRVVYQSNDPVPATVLALVIKGRVSENAVPP